MNPYIYMSELYIYSYIYIHICADLFERWSTNISESEIKTCSVQILDPDPIFELCKMLLEAFLLLRKKNRRSAFISCSVKFGLHAVIRIEETKLICAISRKIILGWK